MVMKASLRRYPAEPATSSGGGRWKGEYRRRRSRCGAADLLPSAHQHRAQTQSSQAASDAWPDRWKALKSFICALLYKILPGLNIFSDCIIDFRTNIMLIIYVDRVCISTTMIW